MPLETEVRRNGEMVSMEWDYFGLSAMYTAAVKEGAPEYEYEKGKTFGDLKDGQWVDFSMAPIYYLDINCDLVKKGSQVLKDRHRFQGRNADHEVVREVVLEPGDVLRARRVGK